jgi:hypothetical protein
VNALGSCAVGVSAVNPDMLCALLQYEDNGFSVSLPC